MASSTILQEFTCDPGIQQDGTKFSATSWIDGQWVRFYNGKPKKVGGFRAVISFPKQVVRVMSAFPVEDSFYAILGMQGVLDNDTGYFKQAVLFVKLERVEEGVYVFQNGEQAQDITPANYRPTLYTTETTDEVIWDFNFIYTSLYKPTSEAGPTNIKGVYLVATYSYLDLSKNVETPVYAWLINPLNLRNDKLTPLYDYQTSLIPPVPDPVPAAVAITTTGGAQVTGSYLIIYGINGLVSWNNGKNLSAWCATDPGTTNPVGSIGGGADNLGAATFIGSIVVKLSDVGCLLFSKTYVAQVTLDEPLIVNKNVGSGDQSVSTPTPINEVFSLSYADQPATCIAPSSIIGIPPTIYWVGLNAFYSYNGGVDEVSNTYNKLFFFKNLDMSQASKIFSYVDFTYHEWKIQFPNINISKFIPGAVYIGECNWEVVYNYKTGEWYDTPLVGALYARAAAMRPSDIMPYTALSANQVDIDGNFPIYLHEIGTDAIDKNIQSSAIPSYITGQVSLELGNSPDSNAVLLSKVIYDFKQTGPMTMSVKAQAYPRSEYSDPDLRTTVFQPTDTFTNPNIKGTILTIQFSSNEKGGDYFMGKTMIELTVTGDRREEGGKK